MKIITDGNTITAKIAYKLTNMASIYPITPSSPMAEHYDELRIKKEKNIFDEVNTVVEMQSEAGSVAALHGALSGGVLATTFTSSQGLLLMIPTLYKLAGEMLPSVIHVAARSVATHALNIFCEHSDVMAIRQTGVCMLASCNVQECLDMALVSHLCALELSLPFVHFFDGFRTSHEIQKIEDITDDEIKKLINYNKLQEFKDNCLTPTKPYLKGSAQNPDVFFQNKEAINLHYNKVADTVESYFEKLKDVTGRSYAPFEYYGDENAENIIISMCSSIETIKQTINKLGKNYGVINVRLFRPFSAKHFLKVLPKSAKRVAVLDRTKENGSTYEPLCLDVISVLKNTNILVIGGRYGLGSKEFTPAMVKAVFDNLTSSSPIDHFTVGINDDVTHLSLTVDDNFKIENNFYSCKFFGLGSDGTVGANKNSIKIIGNLLDYYVQGYFEYDSKKSGSLTTSHLRFGKEKIACPYKIENADFIACHNDSFITKYNILNGIKNNATLLLNTDKDEKKLNEFLPQEFKNILLKKNVKVYTINAKEIAFNYHLRGKINTVMQTCFFKLINLIDFNIVKDELISYVKKTYSSKGEEVVNNNILAINECEKHLKQVRIYDVENSYKTEQKINDDFYNNVMKEILSNNGDKLPVSVFSANGHMPTNTTKFEKRGISENLPCWISENCIQCGRCSLVCPHSCLSALLLDKNQEIKKEFDAINANGTDAKFKIQLSPLDCTGCGNCAKVCPAKNKALKMVDKNEILEKEKNNFEYANTLIRAQNPYSISTVKGSQFNKSYFEFSGACAGCGETPYIKLITQLCGKDLIIANATGCSSIYGGSYPSCPYSMDENGFGPAWANSLFEDNAEFGLGIAISARIKRENLRDYIDVNLEHFNGELQKLLKNWLSEFNNREKANNIAHLIFDFLNNNPTNEYEKYVLDNYENLIKKVTYIIGGDGWAYDIGFGGLDHVLNSGEYVKILVLNTQVYSNTGGQASKATPFGASAKFAGKVNKKQQKDLALYAINIPNVYVSQVAMGADYNQCVKSFYEALNFNGTSLIIAYAPCINHGIDMSNTQNQMKLAVESGMWHLFRYSNNKFILDSKQPNINVREYLKNETRFLNILNDESALKELEQQVKSKYEKLKKLEE